MRSMRKTKADLFSENDVVICDPKICQNEIQGRFATVKSVIEHTGNGVANGQLNADFFDAVEKLGGRYVYENIFTFIGFTAVNNLQSIIRHCGIQLWTLDDVIGKLQTAGYLTDKEQDLSENGWYDQLETTLMEKYNPNTKMFPPDIHMYDYNNMPDHLKTSKQAAFEYAICGYWNHDIVKNSGILSDMDIMADILANLLVYDNVEDLLTLIPDAALYKPNVLTAVSYYDQTRLSNLDQTKFTDDIIETIMADPYVSDEYPNIKNDSAKEPLILKGILKRHAGHIGKTTNEIDQMSSDEQIDKLADLICDDTIDIYLLPDRFTDDETFMRKIDNLYVASNRLKTDRDFATDYCKKHPDAFLDFPVVWPDNEELFLAFLSQGLYGYNHQYNNQKILDIAAENNYYANHDIMVELFKQKVCTLNQTDECDDKDIAIATLKNNPSDYAYLSSELKHDLNVLTALADTATISSWIYNVPDDIKQTAIDIMTNCKKITLAGELSHKVNWEDIPNDMLTEDTATVLLSCSYNQPNANSNMALTNMPKAITLSDNTIKWLLTHSSATVTSLDKILTDVLKVRPDAANWPEYSLATAQFKHASAELKEKRRIGWA